MIERNFRWLAGFSAAYIFLLPTNHGTVLRSIAFGGTVLFAALVVGFWFRDRHRETKFTLPAPPTVVTLTIVAWFAWSALSYFWSVKPRYTALQLSREVGENLLVIAAFYIAAVDVAAFRRYVAVALASFALMAMLALVMALTAGGWDPTLKHNGVGPYSTFVVLTAPLLLTLLAPAPIGLARRGVALALVALLLVLMMATARLTDNRMVWIALAAVFALAAILSALRWPTVYLRSPRRWLAPVAVLLVVFAFAFSQVARERADNNFPPNTSVEATLKADPRLRLWHQLTERIGERVWQGYGFGRRIQAEEIATDTADLALTHAHNLFASQWLQTGAVGLTLFVAMLGAIGMTFVRYVRARDDVLAMLGIVGLSLLTGFVVKNITDDFLFRSNAKELWAMLAILMGLGTRISARAPTP